MLCCDMGIPVPAPRDRLRGAFPGRRSTDDAWSLAEDLQALESVIEPPVPVERPWWGALVSGTGRAQQAARTPGQRGGGGGGGAGLSSSAAQAAGLEEELARLRQLLAGTGRGLDTEGEDVPRDPAGGGGPGAAAGWFTADDARGISELMGEGSTEGEPAEDPYGIRGAREALEQMDLGGGGPGARDGRDLMDELD